MAKTKVRQCQWEKMLDHMTGNTIWGHRLEDREKYEEMFGELMRSEKVFDNIEELFAAKAGPEVEVAASTFF